MRSNFTDGYLYKNAVATFAIFPVEDGNSPNDAIIKPPKVSTSCIKDIKLVAKLSRFDSIKSPTQTLGKDCVCYFSGRYTNPGTELISRSYYPSESSTSLITTFTWNV